MNYEYSNTLEKQNIFDHSVAIFAARESIETLSETIKSIIVNVKNDKTVLDVLVNGNKKLSDTLSNLSDEFLDGVNSKINLRVWYVPFADKAHAWNQYLHFIWPESNLAYFVDGYARVQPESLFRLAQSINDTPAALAATGVPSSGRSADKIRESMLSDGGFHGSLHAIRGETLDELRRREFCLPIGLYRTDALIGAVIAFGLDPAKYKWEPKRTVVEPGATWTFEENSLWRARDLVNHFKRMVRQARGILENRAVRQYLAVEKKAPETLPANADDLIRTWVRDFPKSARNVFLKNPLCLIAARRVRRPRDWSLADVPPTLVACANSVSCTDIRPLAAD